MKRCPFCYESAVRVAFRTRHDGTRIALQCEVCGHVGPEIPLAHMEDTSAALAAATAWDQQLTLPLTALSVARH